MRPVLRIIGWLMAAALGGPVGAVGAASLPGYQLWSYRHDGAPLTGFRDIDAAGNVVGYVQTDASDASTAHALLVVGGVVQVVDPPGSSADRRAFGIADDGSFAGSFADASGQHGFVFDASTAGFATVDVPWAATATTIRALDNAGDVAGEYEDAAGTTRGFVRIGGVFRMIDVPAATRTSVRGIDDAGRMVGYYADTSGRLHGFVSDDGLAFSVIDRPGAFSTLVGGLNADGALVGVTLAGPGSPDTVPASGFLWQAGVFAALDVVGAVSTIPLAINDHGQIAGEYVDALGVHYGFVATPVPEPAPAAGLVAGLLTLSAVLRRRRQQGAVPRT